MSVSSIEKQYKKLMTHHIAKVQVCPEQRAALFLDFLENCDEYYDDLCDTLYRVSVGEVCAPLWMSHSGEVYAASQPKAIRDVFLMNGKDLPPFNGDLWVHFDYIFSRIYSASQAEPTLKLCAFS